MKLSTSGLGQQGHEGIFFSIALLYLLYFIYLFFCSSIQFYFLLLLLLLFLNNACVSHCISSEIYFEEKLNEICSGDGSFIGCIINSCKNDDDDDDGGARGEEVLEFGTMACLRWAVGVPTHGGHPCGLLPSGT